MTQTSFHSTTLMFLDSFLLGWRVAPRIEINQEMAVRVAATLRGPHRAGGAAQLQQNRGSTTGRKLLGQLEAAPGEAHISQN
jgi:hypothetical protein